MKRRETSPRAALVRLATQLALQYVELKKRMAWRERHAVHFAGIPCAHNQPATIRRPLNVLDKSRNLIHATPSGRRQSRHWAP